MIEQNRILMPMRTTVTIDDDLAHRLKGLMREHDLGFKAALNQALRRGLASSPGDRDEPPFVVQARALGLRAGIDPARLNAAADDLETDAFRERSAQSTDRPDS